MNYLVVPEKPISYALDATRPLKSRLKICKKLRDILYNLADFRLLVHPQKGPDARSKRFSRPKRPRWSLREREIALRQSRWAFFRMNYLFDKIRVRLGRDTIRIAFFNQIDRLSTLAIETPTPAAQLRLVLLCKRSYHVFGVFVET